MKSKLDYLEAHKIATATDKTVSHVQTESALAEADAIAKRHGLNLGAVAQDMAGENPHRKVHLEKALAK